MQLFNSVTIKSNKFIISVLVLLGIFGSASLSAQTWPDKPIKMIVPFAAGGSADILGRILSQELSKNLGKT